MILSDAEIAVFRIEINGKLWSSFTDYEEAVRQLDALRSHGMDAVMVPKARKRETASA